VQEVVQAIETPVSAAVPEKVVEPILRWAGGKRWLLPRLRRMLAGHTFARYHEPFLGGASIALGLPGFPQTFLSDINAELIETYQSVRADPGCVSQILGRYSNDESSYYDARAGTPSDAYSRAARFIYLNHTSFNGIYRVNAHGKYNVPFGRRRHVRIPAETHLREAAHKLGNAQIQVADFQLAISNANEGDLLFLDPPYATKGKSESFVRYNPNVFGFDDQKRLGESLSGAIARGAYFVLTNSADPSVRAIFEPMGHAFELRRQSSVGGANAKRGNVPEMLITNIGERSQLVQHLEPGI
jgi:DNA adenine methylase